MLLLPAQGAKLVSKSLPDPDEKTYKRTVTVTPYCVPLPPSLYRSIPFLFSYSFLWITTATVCEVSQSNVLKIPQTQPHPLLHCILLSPYGPASLINTDSVLWLLHSRFIPRLVFFFVFTILIWSSFDCLYGPGKFPFPFPWPKISFSTSPFSLTWAFCPSPSGCPHLFPKAALVSSPETLTSFDL